MDIPEINREVAADSTPTKTALPPDVGDYRVGVHESVAGLVLEPRLKNDGPVEAVNLQSHFIINGGGRYTAIGSYTNGELVIQPGDQFVTYGQFRGSFRICNESLGVYHVLPNSELDKIAAITK